MTKEDVRRVTSRAYRAAFDDSVQAAADALEVAPTTVYGWPDRPNFRFQCAMVEACRHNGRLAKLRVAMRAEADEARTAA